MMDTRFKTIFNIALIILTPINNTLQFHYFFTFFNYKGKIKNTPKDSVFQYILAKNH